MKTNQISFVDFYSSNNISPVAQDISDLKAHFLRRSSLLHILGIPPSFVKNLDFLEFGPGSGHNSLYIANLMPKCYWLVEGNPKGVEDLTKMLSPYKQLDFKIYDSLFLDFVTPKKFDIVWSEGCISGQKNPDVIVEHISSFVRPNGLMVLTTMNGISFLSEICRKLLFEVIDLDNSSIETQVASLKPILQSHLENLKFKTRSTEDWIIDNIIHPLSHSKLFTIPDTLKLLSNTFDIYNSSPNFITEWRWYKEIIGDEREFNNNGLNCYYQNNLNLIDYRYVFKPHSVEFGKTLEDICSRSWDIMCQIQNGDSSQWQTMFDLMGDIASLIQPVALPTARAVIEASEWLQDGASTKRDLQYFPQWWGRGQQYLSLIRKSNG